METKTRLITSPPTVTDERNNLRFRLSVSCLLLVLQAVFLFFWSFVYRFRLVVVVVWFVVVDFVVDFGIVVEVVIEIVVVDDKVVRVCKSA